MKCKIYMGAEDVRRQALNVFRIKMLGAEVVPVTSGSQTLKDAINEAMRDWVVDLPTTHYCVGSAIGPHPFPTIVRDFQRVIGKETKQQLMALKGKLPDAVVACVGGGSNAMGMFFDFIPETSVRLIGVEAGGDGQSASRCRASAIPLSRADFSLLPYSDPQESTLTVIRPLCRSEFPECFTESRRTCSSPRPDRSSRPTPSRLDSTTLCVDLHFPGHLQTGADLFTIDYAISRESDPSTLG